MHEIYVLGSVVIMQVVEYCNLLVSFKISCYEIWLISNS